MTCFCFGRGSASRRQIFIRHLFSRFFVGATGKMNANFGKFRLVFFNIHVTLCLKVLLLVYQ